MTGMIVLNELRRIKSRKRLLVQLSKLFLMANQPLTAMVMIELSMHEETPRERELLRLLRTACSQAYAEVLLDNKDTPTFHAWNDALVSVFNLLIP
jgi:hypothetical protein